MTNQDLSPTLRELTEHGIMVGPDDRYYWYHNTLYVVAQVLPDASTQPLLEAHNLTPGQRVLDNDMRVHTVRKLRSTSGKACDSCGAHIGYGDWYASSTNSVAVCLRCVRGKEGPVP